MKYVFVEQFIEQMLKLEYNFKFKYDNQQIMNNIYND